MSTIRYVAGDRRPYLRLSLESGSSPVDVSLGGVTISAYVRVSGATAIKDTLVGTKTTGRLTSVDANTGEWTVNTAAPWTVAGSGGIVTFAPSATTFNASGTYEVEYEINWGSGILQTVYAVDKVLVRDQFA